jgi:acetyl esterase/lipase
MADAPREMPPFVLPVEVRDFERRASVDIYLPDTAAPRPAVVFVHGGPVDPAARPTPRDWPVFRAYGSLVAERGFVGVTVDHRLHDPTDVQRAADDVSTAVALIRTDPRVDGDRIAVWVFSGGGPILADWLRNPPAWLRVVAATYPVLGEVPGIAMDDRFRPVEALAGAGDLPIVLTRVGLERAGIASTVEDFIAAARERGAILEVVDVPNGRHAFDMLDDTDESREAITRAVDAVLAALERA